MVSINPSIYTLTGNAPMHRNVESNNPTASNQTSTSDVSTYTPSAPVTSDISGSPAVSAILDNIVNTSAIMLEVLKAKVDDYNAIMNKKYKESTGYYMTISGEQKNLGKVIATLAQEIKDKYLSKLSSDDQTYVEDIYNGFISFIKEEEY